MNEGSDASLVARPRRVEGGARIRLRDDAGVTRLAELWHHEPMRVLLPDPIDDALPHVVLLNTSGGLVGGDRVAVKVTLDARARALVTGQAAEKVYRSAGADVTITNQLEIGEGGWLEWLPQETILFDRSRLRRRLTLDLAATARAMAGEIIVFGRRARGEVISDLVLHDSWTVHRAGKLVWADALRLDRDAPAILASPFGFDGAAAMATLVYAARTVLAWSFDRLTPAQWGYVHPRLHSPTPPCSAWWRRSRPATSAAASPLTRLACRSSSADGKGRQHQPGG